MTLEPTDKPAPSPEEPTAVSGEATIPTPAIPLPPIAEEVANELEPEAPIETIEAEVEAVEVEVDMIETEVVREPSFETPVEVIEPEPATYEAPTAENTYYAPPAPNPDYVPYTGSAAYAPPVNPQTGSYPPERKDRIAAGAFAILLGSLGIHKFYLGYTMEGVIILAITIIGSCLTFGIAAGVMATIGVIEGILYITKTPEEFEYLYVTNKRAWF